MIRRLATVAVLLTTAATTGAVLSAPAYAADHVICVNDPVGVTCDQSFALLGAAVNASDGNGLDDTIVLAPGTYTDGPYTLTEVGHHVSLVGSGQGSTFLSLAPGGPQTYLNVHHGSVRDLTVRMNSTTSTSDDGIDATASTLDSVTVDGSNASSATGVFLDDGSTLTRSTVQMSRAANSFTTGVNQFGNGTVTDSTITAAGAYYHSIDGTTATLSRVSVHGAWAGITAADGTVLVDDSLVDLGTTAEGIGLAAINDNNSNTPRSIVANHLTVIGGGNMSVGAGAYARAPGALQQSSITLTNSIIAGPQTSLYVEASNNGLQGANSTATISTSYSDWATSNVVQGANGTATLTSGAGRLNVNPGFRNAAGGDYRLATTSPLIDKGQPGTGGPTLDLGNGPRVLDGNGDGTAVRDPGAYEAPKKVVAHDTTPPNTVITAHPRRRTTRARVTFRFTSNEAHVTFQCRRDRNPWRACTSPRTFRVTRGWHTVRIRARDAAGNVDPTPAIWRFKRI